jgi:hypothetical protein
MNYQKHINIDWSVFPQYKGIYYSYQEAQIENEIPCWILYDKSNREGNLMYFNANIYRIDQCFELWFKENNL